MREQSNKWIAAALVAVAGTTIQASSHREAPGITKTPKLDGTDFYMFRSYEPGRAEFVTLIANYVPLQDVYGGPNFFTLDPDAVYEIHVDNNGDAREDITFQFQFRNRSTQHHRASRRSRWSRCRSSTSAASGRPPTTTPT